MYAQPSKRSYPTYEQNRPLHSAAPAGQSANIDQHQVRPCIFPDHPEVNHIDHTIGAFHGATVALETMPSRLQAAKIRNLELPDNRQKQLEQELDWLKQENKFYGTCCEIYRELRVVYTTVVNIMQKLVLQSYLEPEYCPTWDPTLWDAVQQLDSALKVSREHEKASEADWRRYWNIPLMTEMCATWI
ncbi:hypothetical protein RU639_013581 [Aspergillus parasiticus]